ncbi:hypothetical protein BN946_scf184796.g23 [Trametes cinnabarina]|uniref:BTB domain-containing protein n=1 Tax=Pycnoporus cinnabarinus TaxID=5643 RepID=A0A060SWX6_PYCCI|nr:hypothetical protein BN946_scf184796.g23 [Trametes cinnabarina]
MDTDFSSNRHATPPQEHIIPTRHPELCFPDGNLAVVTGKHYFIVHRGILSRHSEVFGRRIEELDPDRAPRLDGLVAMILDDRAEDFVHFLRALCGLSYDSAAEGFAVRSAILRLSTKYEVSLLRENTLRKLSAAWPTSLRMWETREKAATTAGGEYQPRAIMPHPLLVINLAREVGAYDILPSAFYDLSRCLPSQLMDGFLDADGVRHQLNDDDVGKVLRGKEHCSRYFSTFIVTELEGRGPSVNCLHRNEVQPSVRRTCQMAFESVTFELIRNVNGMASSRHDPLFTISDSIVMQTRDDQPGVENKASHRACEACRLEYLAVVQAVREAFWRQLPAWFEVHVKNWG